MYFLLVVMAGGIAHGCLHTMTLDLPDMAAIHQLMGSQKHAILGYSVFLRYWTSMLWSIVTCHVTIS